MNSNSTSLTESIHIKIPHAIDAKITVYKNSQRIISKSHAMINLIKIGLDVYNTYLTGKYIEPFAMTPIDPRLVTFVDTLSKEDKERLFYHMLAKLPPNELKRIRDLAGVVD